MGNKRFRVEYFTGNPFIVDEDSRKKINEKFTGFKTYDSYEDITELLNDLNSELEAIRPLKETCRKYNIRLEDVADVLEEYVSYDNAEYLEKLERGY